MTDHITPSEFHQAEGTDDWRIVGDGACAFFRAESFAAGARLVQAIAELPGLRRGQPDVDLRHDGVTVRLLTAGPDWYGMTGRDVELAAQISAAARDQGLASDPSAVQSILVIPGASDTSAVMPFWQTRAGL